MVKRTSLDYRRTPSKQRDLIESVNNIQFQPSRMHATLQLLGADAQSDIFVRSPAIDHVRVGSRNVEQMPILWTDENKILVLRSDLDEGAQYRLKVVDRAARRPGILDQGIEANSHEI